MRIKHDAGCLYVGPRVYCKPTLAGRHAGDWLFAIACVLGMLAFWCWFWWQGGAP